MNPETVARHYAICALWASVDDGGEPLDARFDLSDIAPETLSAMCEDCEKFAKSCKDLLTASGLSDEQIGHDFWLTRNSHGAGFWDRGLGEIGKELTKMCKPYGSFDLYVGDDGMVYGA